MGDRAKAILLRLLRVPAEPKPPEGSPESLRIFRAGRNYYRWRLAQWAMLQLVILLSLLSLTLIPAPRKRPPEMVIAAWRAMEAALIAGFALTLPVTYFIQRLNYEMRWYIVTDRSLRLRSGIWRVQELTMTFANIQNIRVSAGPLQRLLQIADVEVDSAGGPAASAGIPSSHTAKLAGVDNAAAIRDLILDRLRRYRDAGLGDPDDSRHSPSGPGAARAAALEMLAESRALRSALTR